MRGTFAKTSTHQLGHRFSDIVVHRLLTSRVSIPTTLRTFLKCNKEGSSAWCMRSTFEVDFGRALETDGDADHHEHLH